LVAQLASEFNLEVELKNIILVAFRFFEFLHSLGQNRKSRPCAGVRAISTPPCTGRIQKRKTNHLQIIKSSLQRTAGSEVAAYSSTSSAPPSKVTGSSFS
jgi:hypothetical protein